MRIFILIIDLLMEDKIVNLFNQSMNKKDILKRVRGISQTRGASKVICNYGLDKGTELIIVKNS